MEGWIKIHRQIKDHWIWKSQNRFQWWIDILISVNHADTKVLIKGNLIECKRGQSVRSLDTWAKEWNVTKKTVKEFFELLQKDSMLLYESIQISTRITVCNYDNYQTEVNAKETKSKRKVNGQETDTTPKQEGLRIIKNDNNKKKYSNIPPTLEEVDFRIKERLITNFTAESFIAHYEANGWMIGKNKMKNWDATLTTWKNKNFNDNGHTGKSNQRSGERTNNYWNQQN
jgi:hypothetical protein